MWIRRSALILSLFLAISFGAIASDRPNIPPKKNYAQAAAILSRFIEHELADKHLPAISVALVDGNEIVWAQGFGYSDPDRKVPATAETVYRVGSVSKLFTDIGIMQMVEQGKINLDAPISTYLPDFKPANQFSKPITLRQLMSHRAGIIREPAVGSYFDPTEPDLAATVRSLSGYPLIYEPETRVKYSNAGIATVGYTLETLGKKPFTQYLKDAVLKPLGLRSSAFEPEPELKKNLARAYMWTYDGKVFEAPTFQLGMAPAGSMYSTVADLGRFLTVLFNDGRGPDGPVLKPETLHQMWEPQFKSGQGPRNFGIGFVLNTYQGHRIVGHAGAIYGFATELDALPDDKLGAAATTTMDSSNAVTAHIVREALKLMLAVKEGKPIKEIEVSEPIPPELMHKLAGHYGEGDSAVDLIERRGDLYFLPSNGGYEVRLRKTGDALIVDDRLDWGMKLILAEDGIKLGSDVLKKSPALVGKDLPADWKGLIGEYGWDHDVLYIFERQGRLFSLIEWYEYQPLEPVSQDVFLYPSRGLYDHEKFMFTRDANGKAVQVQVGEVVFKRRANNVRWDP
jgi:CubicO group peptidase (beta-lactamase class C family)